MNLTDRQKMFLHEAIHSKLIKAEGMVRYLNDEVAKENSKCSPIDLKAQGGIN